MAEIKEARVPDLGNYHDVPVIEVLVAVGENVEKDQGLVTLESDKATMEVPAPFSGVVKEIKVKVDDTVSAGDVVAQIEAGEVGVEAEPSELIAEPPPNSPGVLERRPPPTSATSVMVSATTSNPAPASIPSASPSSVPQSPPIAFGAGTVMPENVPYATPAVRLFARELGVNLASVKGSGRGGRIVKKDVQQFVKNALSGAGDNAVSMGGAGLNLLPWPKIDFSQFGEVEVKSLSRIKKLSGANLARNWAMIPHVTQHDLADITDLEALRVALNEEYRKQDVKVTLLAFLLKVCAIGLRQFPDFNASLDTDGEQLVMKKYCHIGFAADTPNGLVVPVIRDVDKKGVVELAQETAQLAGKAREGKLTPSEMSGGCFSISSLGGIGGTAFTPIVNAPEVAILGVSRSMMQAVWNGQQFEPRLMLPLSLSYDHRVIDGAAAARFTAYLARMLADMRRALL